MRIQKLEVELLMAMGVVQSDPQICDFFTQISLSRKLGPNDVFAVADISASYQNVSRPVVSTINRHL